MTHDATHGMRRAGRTSHPGAPTAARAQAAAVELVGVASSDGNRTRHTVTVPSAVRAGDQLVLFLTMNGTDTPHRPGGPVTWTPGGHLVRAAGSGKVSAMLTDSGTPLAPGQRGGLIATTAPATSRVAAFSVVIAPD